MKTIKRNGFKILILLLLAIFTMQTLTFNVGTLSAEMLSIANSSYVTPLASTTKKVIKSATEFASWLNSGTNRNIEVELEGGAGTVFDMTGKTYSSKSITGVTFNGNYCTIIGLNKPLFDTATNCIIKNVYIGSGSMSTTTTAIFGAVACTSNGSTFDNCINSMILTVACNYTSKSQKATMVAVGGIVGYAKGSTTITRSSNHASIYADYTDGSTRNKAKTYAGGIVGYAEANTTINNCYVAPLNTSSTIAITATASEITDGAQTLYTKNKSWYYSGLTHVVTKVNEKVEETKQKIFGYQNEVSTFDRLITQQKNNIKTSQNRISQLKREKSKLKWYQVPSKAWYDAQIALEGIKIAGYGIAIGGLEASRAVAYGALTAAQALLKGLAAVITYNYRDTNWLQATDKVTKVVKHNDAYAYGIGYINRSTSNSKKNIEYSYTYGVSTVGGGSEVTYTWPLQFWSTSEWLNGVYKSDEFTYKMVFTTKNNYGPITNDANIVNECYYYTKPDTYASKRDIRVYDSTEQGNSNWYGKEKYSTNKVSVYVSLEKQQLFVSTAGSKKDQLVIMVNNGRTFINQWFNDFAGLGTKIHTMSFDSEVGAMVGNGNTALSTNSIPAKNKLNNKGGGAWGVSANINNGYPYLKCRYWQEVAG